jgi:hypothetical protein
MTPPDNPAGEYVPVPVPTPDQLAAGIAEIGNLPFVVRTLVAGWESDRLDVKYRNWTVRQIVHHLADSHANAIIRFKLALTEDTPTIKPYEPGPWVAQPDATDLPADVSVAMLEAIHRRWAYLLVRLSPAELARAYFHPEFNRAVPLAEAVGQYAWHGRHHTAQIQWLKDRHGWT